LEVGKLDFTIADVGQYVGKRTSGDIESSHKGLFIFGSLPVVIAL
jgi:hypothetical protein